MSDYLQPDFYRFNQDSLDLVRWIKGQVKSAESILDLGAGSGIVGLELAQILNPNRLSLIELQPDFKPFLEHNINLFAPASVQTEVVISSFAKYRPQQRFELIALNPPYFLPGRGESAADFRKQQCRTFMQDDWQELSRCIKRCLKPRGQCFMVVRQDPNVMAEINKSFSAKGFQWHEQMEEKIVLIRLNLTE